ncbi:MAG: hypothetical protein NTY30_02815 [Candidatus Berkelbacteria bacterium]|nr:hypothetical protein [Candidatus Berkelbacteria bacterium]
MVKVTIIGPPRLSRGAVSRKVPSVETQAAQNAVAIGTGEFVENHRRWLMRSKAAAQTKIAGGD